MFNILQLLVAFVWESLYTYAASEEGGAELRVILDAVEASGIDIPFYAPSNPEGQEGVTSPNKGSVGTQSEASVDHSARRPARRTQSGVDA